MTPPPARATGGPRLQVAGLVVGLCFRGCSLLAQRLAREREAVQHGVSHGLVANPLVPMLNGQLAGDDGGAVARTVINDLQQIRSGLPLHGRHAPTCPQGCLRAYALGVHRHVQRR